MQHNHGWLPDRHDPRDHWSLLSSFAAAAPAALPARVSLRSQMPMVYDQGPLGSCTYNAVGGLLQYNRFRQGDRGAPIPSRLFGYWNERWLEGSVAQDAGASLRDGIRATIMWGWADERLWPYDPRQFAVRPPDSVYAAARPHAITKYARVPQTREAIQTHIATGNPVTMGFQVYSSVYRPVRGRIANPVSGERPVGGHAVLLIGYDEWGFEFRNSWGVTWGEFGYGWVRYDYALSPLAADFWTVTFAP